MSDLILSPTTGDLDLGENNSKGFQFHKNSGDEAAQRLNQAVQINLGEWFVNVLDGLPLVRNPTENLPENLRYFFGGSIASSPRFVYNSLNSYIDSLPFIEELISSEYHFDNDKRVFSYTYQAGLVEGGVIEFPTISYDID